MVATAAVTVEQAAAILGVSASTVRRRIRAGSLRAEEARRPQGPVWLVYLPADAVPDASQVSPAAAPVATAPTAQTEAMATWAASLLVPIAAELGEARQVIVSQGEKLQAQAETIGRQGAELEAERRARQQFVIERDAAELSRQHDRRRLLVTVAVLVAVTLVAGTLAVAGWGL